MTRPKFANTMPNTSRRPRSEEESQESLPAEHISTTSSQTLPPITEYMTQQMHAKAKEATRPITLRFEDTLWQKVEDLRGSLTKNDFFKVLVDYYEKSHGKKPVETSLEN